MWIFLVTEILFFGGLFLAYTINRHAFPTAFGIGGNMLDLPLGACEHRRPDLEQLYDGDGRLVRSDQQQNTGYDFPDFHADSWQVFLGVKVVEYKQKFDHHLIPGHGFDITYCRKTRQHADSMTKNCANEIKEIKEGVEAEASASSR